MKNTFQKVYAKIIRQQNMYNVPQIKQMVASDFIFQAGKYYTCTPDRQQLIDLTEQPQQLEAQGVTEEQLLQVVQGLDRITAKTVVYNYISQKYNNFSNQIFKYFDIIAIQPDYSVISNGAPYSVIGFKFLVKCKTSISIEEAIIKFNTDQPQTYIFSQQSYSSIQAIKTAFQQIDSKEAKIRWNNMIKLINFNRK